MWLTPQLQAVFGFWSKEWAKSETLELKSESKPSSLDFTYTGLQMPIVYWHTISLEWIEMTA